MALKIVDSHMHITQWNRINGDDMFKSIQEYQQDNNIAAIDNMSCSNNNNLWKGYEMNQTIIGAICKLENPNVFSHGCVYIPDDYTKISQFKFKDQLDEMLELGLDGVKICDFKPDAYKLLHVENLLDEYEDYIAACEQKNVHMCWHVADPDNNWDEDRVTEAARNSGWFYGDDSFPTFEYLINMTYALLDKHPKLNVTLAHAFFKSFQPEEVEALLNKYPCVTIDLAPGWEMMQGFYANYDAWYRIFREYSDRFLYATDANVSTKAEHVNRLAKDVLRFLSTDDEFEITVKRYITTKGICLQDEQLDNVLYKNHQRVVGKTPKPINKQALKKYIEKYLPLMPDTFNKQMIEKYYREKLC